MVLIYKFIQNVTAFPQAEASPSSPRTSAVSCALCVKPETFVNFEVIVQPKSETEEQSEPLTATIKAKGKECNAKLNKLIDPLIGVDFVQVKSRSSEVLCIKALVVDVNIMIDNETEFKLPIDPDSKRCKVGYANNFGCKLYPVFVCPGAIKELMMTKHIIRRDAEEKRPLEQGKPPVYDITEDMVKATSAIIDGLAEGANDVMKQRKKAKLEKVSKLFNNFKSFLQKVGPALNSLGGMASILTTFLTPNPFDELANYMKEQFDAVQKQMRELKSDIQNLEKIVESQINKLAMATAFRNIRFSSRSYQRMIAALSKARVCNSRDLLAQSEVKMFMKETMLLDVRNHLEDILEVDFGGVLEASTGLLLPLTKAYCNNDKTRVKKFMEQITLYVNGGTLALFAFLDLTCLRNGNTSCPNVETEKETLLKKLYRFTKKARAHQEAMENGFNGSFIDMQDHLDKLISDEVKKASCSQQISVCSFPNLFEKVRKYILQKFNNTRGWPYLCFVKPHLDAGKMFILGVAQIAGEGEKGRIFGTAYKPWALFDKATLQNESYTPLISESSYTKTYLSSSLMDAINKNDRSSLFDGDPPTDVSKDRIMYFMFNPVNYRDDDGTRLVGHVVPIDIYFAKKAKLKAKGLNSLAKKPTVGCWETDVEDESQIHPAGYLKPYRYQCEVPDSSKPNKRESSKERYAAIVPVD